MNNEPFKKVKSVNFYEADRDLLNWCLTRPEDFSNFVKSILYQAMERAHSPPGHHQHSSNGISPDELDRIITEVIRREMAAHLVATGQSPVGEGEADVDLELEMNLESLF